MNPEMSKRNADFRGAVSKMNPVDAKEYLLGVLDMIFNPADDFGWIHEAGVKTTPTRMRMLNLMRLREGKVVAHNDLYAVICGSRSVDEWPDLDIIKTHIGMVRKAIKHTGWEVTTFWGQGYSLRRLPSGFIPV